MQRPQEMQHQQRSPGPPVATGNKGGANNPSVTPTRKTRRGKRGGRGRSLSPRTGLPSGAVGVGGRAAGMNYHTALGSWFPNHQPHFSGSQMGHGPPSLLPPAPPFLRCHQQQQQQQQQQHQQRDKREEVNEVKPPVAAGTAMSTVSASTTTWGNQVFVDPQSIHWNNTGSPFYPGFNPGRSAFGPNTSPIAQHPGEGEAGPGGRSGVADAGGNGRGATKPLPPGPSARVDAGLRRPTEPPSVLAGRVQNHLHALACLFFNCSKHGERPSMVDMAMAEEQLRGASDLMLELQQRLVETHQYGRPAPQPHVAPSRLPRENFQDAPAYEEHPNVSGPPGNDATKRFTSAWEAELEVLPTGSVGLETRARGVYVGPNPGAPSGIDCEWQGGPGEPRGLRGAVEAGGDGGLRTQALRLCSAGRTDGYNEAAAATEAAPSPRPGSFLPLTIEVADDTIATVMPAASAAIGSLSSPDNDIEMIQGEMLPTKKKKRRGKRGIRKGKKQMEGFAGFPLAPGLGPEFAGQPRRRLPKAPSLEIMRGEHDLSEYCLQDEGGSQIDSSDDKQNTTRDGESESLAWAEEHPSRRGVLPAERHGDGVRRDSDDAFGVHVFWQGGGERAPTPAAATTGATNGVRGVGGWRGDDEEEASGEAGNEQHVEGNEEGVGSASAYFEEGHQRLGQTLGPAAGVSRRIDSARHAESKSNKTGFSQQDSEKNNDTDTNNAYAKASNRYGFSASHERPAMEAEGKARRDGEEGGAGSSYEFSPSSNKDNHPRKSSTKEYIRGGSTFFPETDDDDDDGGGTHETRRSPSPATPSAVKVTQKGHLSEYGDGGGAHTRRRSSGVSEEILTAGARALAESVSMKPSATGNSQQPSQQQSAGGVTGSSGDHDFAYGRDGGRGEGGPNRLGPDEATPTTRGSASAASTAAICAGRGGRERWPRTIFVEGEFVEGEPTPRLYGGNHETSRHSAVAGVDERACSPGGVEERFGPDGPHRPNASLCSTEPSGRGVTAERKPTPSGRCESGSLLKEGCSPYGAPRYKATVADVQQAFERVDTRVAREAAQSPRSDNSEGTGQHNRQLRGVADVGGGQESNVIGLAGGPKTGYGCKEEDDNLNSTIRRIWSCASDSSVEDGGIPGSTPRLGPTSSSLATDASAPFTAMRFFQRTQTHHQNQKIQHSEQAQQRQGTPLQQEDQHKQLHQSGMNTRLPDSETR